MLIKNEILFLLGKKDNKKTILRRDQIKVLQNGGCIQAIIIYFYIFTSKCSQVYHIAGFLLVST